MTLYQRRMFVNRLSLTASVVVTAFGLFWLFWLLLTLFQNGIQWLRADVFFQNTPPPGTSGGLMNAILGSVIMTGVGVSIGAPIGILVATYLAEYGRNRVVATVVRLFNDVLLSTPSIIIGVFVYGIIVLKTGHFSGWAGGLALSLIVLPIVARTTEDMLRLVPDSLREAAVALGAPYWKVVVSIVYRAARAGIATGVLLAVSRIAGETAPLLFTALNNQFLSADLEAPMPNLPVVIFQFALSPYDDWQHLAWVGAFLITFTVLILNILARYIMARR